MVARFCGLAPYVQLRKDAVAYVRAIRTETISMIGKGTEPVWWMRKAFETGNQAHLENVKVIAHDIARGTVAAYYLEANSVVSLPYHNPQSGTPSYKSVPTRVRSKARKNKKRVRIY